MVSILNIFITSSTLNTFYDTCVPYRRNSATFAIISVFNIPVM